MRFVFRLKKALQFAQMREARKRTQVAQGNQRVLWLQGRIKELASQVQSNLAAGFTDPRGSAFYTSKVELDMAERRDLEATLRQELEYLADNRAQLSRLSMRRKALDKLHDKRLSEFRLDQRRREQKEIDDIAQQKHSRNKQG